MDVDEDLDTHICLKCQKTIIGLDNYVAHKRTECPNLPIKPVSPEQSRDSPKEPDNTSPRVIVPALTATEQSCQLRSDDFFLSLELKSSRLVEQKASQCQSEEITKSEVFESLPVEELVGNDSYNDPNSSEKEGRSEPKPTDFMYIGAEDEDGEFEYYEEDFDDDECPPRGYTGGKWKPGTRLEDSASWLSTPPHFSNVAEGGVTTRTESTKKRAQKAYARRTTCKCEPCDLTFAKKSGLVSHLASPEHWLASGRHPQHEHLILSHAEALAPLAPFKCTICAYYFNDFKELVAHWASEDETHLLKVGLYRQLVCISCRYRCWTTTEMLEHLNNVAHGRGVTGWKPVEIAATSELCCSLCDWTCGRQQALFSHMRWKHSKNIHCTICRISFASEDALEHHNSLNEHVTNGYDCSLCPFVGDSKSSVTAHMTQEHQKISGVKRPRGRPRLEESKKFKSGEEINDAPWLLLKPMPLSEKKKSLNRIGAGENAAGDPSELQVLKTKAKSEDHTYYESELSSTGEEEQELDKDYVVKQENSNKNAGDALNKRGRSKVCNHCLQDFADTKLLRSHLLEFHPEQLLSCEACCATFVRKSEFVAHLKGLIHRCNTKYFRDLDKGQAVPTGRFACKQCAFHSTSKSGIIFHEMFHSPKPGEATVAFVDDGVDVREEVLCVEIDQFGNVQPVKEEAISDKGNDSSSAFDKEGLKKKSKLNQYSMLPCPVCRKELTPTLLLDHLNIHTGEKPWKCPVCQACFSLRGTLVSHQRSKHGERKHACPHCPYRSNRKAKLTEHLETHEERVRECTCDICGAGFFKSSALQSHMKVHSHDKGKRIACPYEGCSKAFRSQTELVHHCRAHTGDRPFLCETCGYSTTSRHQLTKHERSHSGVKPFKCNYCSYASSRSAQLRRHVRIHSCTRPYLCPHCNYTSSNQENLRKHVLKSKKHAGLFVYPCKHCEYGCNTANEMKEHTVAQHPDVAQQFDPDNPAFASLVAGIYNQKGDLRAPIDTPAPYTPRTELRDMYKNLHSKLQAKVDSCETDSGSQLQGEEICDDDNNVIVRVVLADTLENGVYEESEVSSAVEYLVESTKRKGQVKSSSKTVDNSQLYQLLNQDAEGTYQQEKAGAEEPADPQNQVTVCTVGLPGDQATEEIITSDICEESEAIEIAACDEPQQDAVILPFDAIEHSSVSANDDQAMIIQDLENGRTLTTSSGDGETIILYMRIL